MCVWGGGGGQGGRRMNRGTQRRGRTEHGCNIGGVPKAKRKVNPLSFTELDLLDPPDRHQVFQVTRD